MYLMRSSKERGPVSSIKNYDRTKVERLMINYLNCILILFYLWLMINQNTLERESVCGEFSLIYCLHDVTS